jgi:hypothetical protein
MRTLSLISGLLAIFLFVGCDQNSNPVLPDSTLRGDISGKVILHQDYRQEDPLQTNEGVEVSIEGTTLSTLSDRDGKWTISGLAEGSYTLVLSKNLYETYKQNFVYKVGVPFSINATLYKIPAFEITNLSTEFVGNECVIKGNLVGNVSRYAAIRLYFSTDRNVSSTNNVFSTYEIIRENAFGTATVYAFRKSGSFSLQTFYSKGIVGRQVYIVAYADGENPGRPALNSQSSNIATLLVP